MKLRVLIVAIAAALLMAGEVEACRIYSSPMITYDQWFETADQIVLGQVASVGQLEEADENGRTWARPVMEVDRTRILRGVSSPDRISLRGEDVVQFCTPTLHSEILRLRVGDEVLIMLDEKQTAYGLMRASSDAAQAYVARLTPSTD